jgi:glyoxylase-like metal-dependent hydrolase (beta-lactamase superfamily II)
MQNPDGRLARIGQYFAGPAHPVARTLQEGDKVGGFVVIETPGHTPGHISFWCEQDRVLVLGDVLFHRNPVTLRRGLQEPFAVFAHSPQMNRESARKAAALALAVICFGHGKPLRDGERFTRFVSDMPKD